MSQLSNALSNILIRRLDQKLSCFEVQNYHCQPASLRSIKCMFCKVGIIDLGILSTLKIWEHVEISDITKIIFQCKMIIGEHFYIFDNPQYAQYPYNLTSHMYRSKWCILSKKLIFSKFIEISISVEISDHPKNISIGWNMIKRTFFIFYSMIIRPKLTILEGCANPPPKPRFWGG